MARRRYTYGQPHLTRRRGKSKLWWGWVDGREIALRTPDRDEANKRLGIAAAERERVEDRAEAATSAKLSEVALPFGEFCQPPRYTEQSARSVTERVTRFIEWAEGEGHGRIENVSLSVLRLFVRARGKAKASNSTINRDLSAVRAFLRYAATEGYAAMKLDPATYAELRVREPRPEPNGVTLSVAQVDAFLEKADSVSSTGYAALFRLTAGSGIRIDEARHLAPSDLHDADGKLGISPKPPHWTTKGYRARKVPVSKATLKAARAFIKCRDDLVLDDKTIWLEIRRIRRLAELPHFSMHDLRRAWASAMHANGASLKQISVWLGHSAMQVTERYVRLLDDAESGHAYLPR